MKVIFLLNWVINLPLCFSLFAPVDKVTKTRRVQLHHFPVGVLRSHSLWTSEVQKCLNVQMNLYESAFKGNDTFSFRAFQCVCVWWRVSDAAVIHSDVFFSVQDAVAVRAQRRGGPRAPRRALHQLWRGAVQGETQLHWGSLSPSPDSASLKAFARL